MRTDQFNFDLPAQLIAQHPPLQRGNSRLLHVASQQLTDLHFPAIVNLLHAGDVLILNDTKVIKARLFGQKASGGKIEVLIERVLNEHEVLAQVRASHAPKPGSQLLLAEVLEVEMLERRGEFFRLRFHAAENVLDLLERHGKLPLPPYITHGADEEDDRRYQTVFAREAGAVAAPTAGLHFTESLLETLRAKGVVICYVTLHVGAGTFQPVRSEYIEQHHMHHERYIVPENTITAIQQAHRQGHQVVAVGTTSLRALESAAQSGQLRSGSGDTDIFITPGYRFRVVNRLLTNFHLPQSTLLMLVCAFGGMDNLLAAYRHAVAEGYRFFSYGDAMLIECVSFPSSSQS